MTIKNLTVNAAVKIAAIALSMDYCTVEIQNDPTKSMAESQAHCTVKLHGSFTIDELETIIK